MRLKLQLLNKFRLSHAETDETISMRSNGRILAYLAWKSDEPVERRELLKALWPGEPTSVAANRLRVALARLRVSLEDVLVESHSGLTLNWSKVSCDWHDLKDAERDSRNNVALRDEYEALLALLPQLSQTLFANEPEPWQAEAQVEWREWAGRTSLRLADLSHLLGETESCEMAAESGLAHTPAEPRLWVHLLRIAESQGKGQAAVRRLQAFQKHTTIQDQALSEWIEQIQRRQQEAFHPSHPLLPDELEFAGSLIEVLIERQPSLARQVLGSPETKASTGRNPRIMLNLLLRVIEEPEETDPYWERCVARAIGLKAWLNDHDGVLELAPGLLRKSTDPIIRRVVLISVSTAKSLVRDWPGAMEAIDEATEIARAYGDPIDALNTESNKATYLWLQGRYSESLELYSRTISSLEKHPDPRSDFDRLIGIGNRAFIPVMQGDFAKGKEWLEDSIAQREASSLNVPPGLQTSCLAMVKAILGDREGLAQLMHQGLVDAFQSDSERFKILALEFCAGALIAVGEESLGWSILERCDQWRSGIKHPRAQAELDLVNNLVERVPTRSRRQALPQDVTPGRLGKLGIQRLAKSLER